MILLINILILIFTVVFIKNSLKNEPSSSENANLPTLLASEINYLVKDVGYLNRGILVTLLDLKNRGLIEIERYERESRNKVLEDFVVEYKFTLLDKKNLKVHEKLFLDNIFKNKSQVTTDELTQRAIDGKEFLNAQGKWALEIEKELKNMSIISSSEGKQGSQLIFLGLGF